METLSSVSSRKAKQVAISFPTTFLMPEDLPQLFHPIDALDLSNQITQLLQICPDTELVLPFLTHLLGDVFQANLCMIVAGSQDQTQLQIVYWSNQTGNGSSQVAMELLENSIISSLLTEYEPLVLPHLELEIHQFLSHYEEELEIRSILGIATQFQGKWNGMVCLLRSQPQAWEPLHVDYLQKVSDSIALAIGQVMQMQYISCLENQVHTAAQRQNLIEQLTLGTRNSLELDEILHIAIQGAIESLQIDRGMILLFKYLEPAIKWRSSNQLTGQLTGQSAGGETGKIRATVTAEWHRLSKSVSKSPKRRSKRRSLEEDPSSIPVKGYSFWISDCYLCQQALADSPNPLVISSWYDRDFNQAMNPGTGLSGIAPILQVDTMPFLLLLPLESQGTVLGFLILQHQQPYTWKAEELKFLELITAQITTAIIQTQTLRQVQALVEERTVQLQKSLEVQGKLYETTRRQIDQLQHLNRLKDEFLSTVSHELLTPLTSMSLAIRMLRQPGLSIERHSKYLDVLEQQCTQETNLIHDLLTLQKLEANQVPIQWQKIDLKTLISEIVQNFEQHYTVKELKLEVELPARSLLLNSDWESLTRILTELLSNAGKYSDPGTTIYLKAEQQVLDQTSQIVLSISNTGNGILPEDLPHIFNKFHRGQGVTQKAVQGTGLGLALVKSLVHYLNGTIAASSSEIGNTETHRVCFIVTLPQFSYASPT